MLKSEGSVVSVFVVQSSVNLSPENPSVRIGCRISTWFTRVAVVFEGDT